MSRWKISSTLQRMKAGRGALPRNNRDDIFPEEPSFSGSWTNRLRGVMPPHGWDPDAADW